MLRGYIKHDFIGRIDTDQFKLAVGGVETVKVECQIPACTTGQSLCANWNAFQRAPYVSTGYFGALQISLTRLEHPGTAWLRGWMVLGFGGRNSEINRKNTNNWTPKSSTHFYRAVLRFTQSTYSLKLLHQILSRLRQIQLCNGQMCLNCSSARILPPRHVLRYSHGFWDSPACQYAQSVQSKPLWPYQAHQHAQTPQQRVMGPILGDGTKILK